jgi:hypothetical protein
MKMDLENDDMQAQHDGANAAQLDEDREYVEDLAYFSGIDPADIVDWDKSSDNPRNSGNPKTAETAAEQEEIERRAVADFEQERLDQDDQ